MVKIVIVGQDTDRLDIIKEQLKPLKEASNHVTIQTTKPNYVGTMIDHHLTLMICDSGEINGHIFPFINQIRKLKFTGPILLTAHLPANFDLKEITKEKFFYFLKKPYSQEQLLGIVKNCITVQNMRQRRDQRFDVREQATLQAYSSDFSTETVINNISKSGARIEGNLSGLKQGDLLRLHFNFEKIKKERILSARVVWLKKDGDTKEEAGLEFVSQQTVYRYLLEHAAA